jgi:hypothetical protein
VSLSHQHNLGFKTKDSFFKINKNAYGLLDNMAEKNQVSNSKFGKTETRFTRKPNTGVMRRTSEIRLPNIQAQDKLKRESQSSMRHYHKSRTEKLM